MNTNDLPPAARLAALIEAGRAANPDLKHGTCHLLYSGRACAIGFAALAAGASRERMETHFIHESNDPFWLEAYHVLGPEIKAMGLDSVWRMNDAGASLDEIITSLREGKLAKLTA